MIVKGVCAYVWACRSGKGVRPEDVMQGHPPTPPSGRHNKFNLANYIVAVSVYCCVLAILK